MKRVFLLLLLVMSGILVMANNRATLTFDFEDGTAGDWTQIDADGDGYSWMLHAPDENYVNDLGHNGSNYYVCSESYNNDNNVALTPDNYLVSPMVLLGGSITFYAQAQDPDWAAEHFGVAVSTTNGYSADAFTTIAEWTMTAKRTGATGIHKNRSGNRTTAEWFEYTVDLSAYSGEGYVAIRHFNCTDQFILNVDDITIAEGAPVGAITFEDGQIPADWNNDASYPWFVASPEYPGYNGSYCMMCGNSGVSNSTSTMEATVYFVRDGSISFLAGCWGEGSDDSYDWDKCRFYIDGELMFDYGAHQTWESMTYAVSAGEHTFTWTYKKDGSVNPTGDFFAVDDVSFVGAGTQTTTFTVTATANPTEGGYLTMENAVLFSDDFDNGISNWTTIDADGDGYTWVSSMNPGDYHNSGVNLAGTGHNSSEAYAISGSWINQPGQALTPDNYFVSPQLTLGGTFSFWACGQDANYAAEHFGVAVSTTSNNNAAAFTTIQEWTLTAKSSSNTMSAGRDGNNRAQGNWYQFSVDLSAFNGQTGYIAIRHFDVTDQFILNVDDVELRGNIVGTTVTGTFAEGETCSLTATANSGYNFINWTENGNTLSGNTTYSFAVNSNRTLNANFQQQQVQTWTITATPDPEEGGYVTIGYRDRDELTYDFEDGAQGWTTLDADGDGFNWDLHVNTGTDNHATHSGDAVMVSASYDNDSSTALTPDNYLISPQVTLGGSITFYACAQDESWAAEHFGVAVSTTNNTSASAFTTIQEWDLSAKRAGAPTDFTRGGGTRSGAWYEYTVDLSAYSGTGYVAIRHFNCTDMFFINVDDITITEENGGGQTGGTVSAVFEDGQTCILSAFPYTGYYFVNWTENGTSFTTDTNPYSFEVHGDRNFVAHFAPEGPNTYTVNVSANPTNGGTVTGGGVFEAGQNCTVVATADDCYAFVNWTENGTVVSTNASYTFAVNAGHNLVANFEFQSYTVTATPNPVEGGTVAFGRNNRELVFSDDFENGIVNWTTIDADGDGYDWYDLIDDNPNNIPGHNGSLGFATSASYQGSALTPDNYLVSPQVALNGTFSFWACGQDASWAAEHFGVAISTTNNTSASAFTTIQEWTLSAKGGSGVYTRATRDGQYRDQGNWYEFTVDLSSYNGQMGYIAIRHFDVTDMFRINVDDVELNATAGGGDAISATYDCGESCTVTATANTGYTFVNWTENGTVVSSNNVYTFDVDADRNLVANFVLQSTPTYTIAVSANPTEGGEVEGGGTVAQGQSCTVVATPSEPCYTFVNWTENGTVVSTNASYTINNITADHALVANFEFQTYTITATPNPVEGGTVAFNGREVVFSDDFENGLANWTTIDADGDGNDWYTLNWIDAGWDETGGHSGESWATSASYASAALTPDNYLVSPQLTLGGTLTFWACAQDPDWAAEHFGVAVSTTNNSDASAFTTIQEWTLTAKGLGARTPDSRSRVNRIGNYYQYTVDLSAYDGQTGYIAIRHFGCTDMFRINIDDVELTANGGGGQVEGTITADFDCGETCTLVATPNIDYEFVNWTENGVEVSTEMTYTFTVEGNRDLVANFTLKDGVDENIVEIALYPNPVNDLLNVVASEDIDNLEVFFITGAMVYSKTNCSSRVEINTSAFATGTYVIRMTTQSTTEVRRFVKY